MWEDLPALQEGSKIAEIYKETAQQMVESLVRKKYQLAAN